MCKKELEIVFKSIRMGTSFPVSSTYLSRASYAVGLHSPARSHTQKVSACFAATVWKFLRIYQQGTLNFHFSLGPTNYVTPIFSLECGFPQSMGSSFTWGAAFPQDLVILHGRLELNFKQENLQHLSNKLYLLYYYHIRQ